ncbi:MAG: rhodanese-like domain-containing protein [Spirochaetales bacterium]|nr:rhodanese-like domain-containing protein [Spirochaetales bacterium]
METQYALVIGLIAAFYVYKVVGGQLKYKRLIKLIESDSAFTLIDVRTSGEYASGHIPGARNIPYESVGDSLKKTAKDGEIVLYCQSGSRARAAKATLAGKGYSNVWNFGGIGQWRGKLEK